MKKCWLISFGLLFFSMTSLANPAESSVILEKVHINTANKASLTRGAKFFATYCMVCHTLKYLKNDPIAKAAGIDYDKMPVQQQSWWLNTPPPDLTLETRRRGANWVYTYLHSFYLDPSKPSNNNNLLIDNVNMPNPFTGMQGIQILVVDKKKLQTYGFSKKPRWFDAVELTKQGSMTPEQFDQTTTDLVNFLVYAGDPQKAHREHMGWWVLGFLVIFLIPVYLLKKLYWKNIKFRNPR